jgi:hypothetical protein
VKTPDNRAQHADPSVLQDGVKEGLTAMQILTSEAFPVAAFCGVVAAVLCMLAYASVGSFGVLMSIVAVGSAWLIAKAMLIASWGYGGKVYQILAAVLTYFTVTFGNVLAPVSHAVHSGRPISIPYVVAYAAIEPVFWLRTGISGIVGIAILGYAMRTAWRMGKGTRTL